MVENLCALKEAKKLLDFTTRTIQQWNRQSASEVNCGKWGVAKVPICPICKQAVDAFYDHVLKAHGRDALDRALSGELRPIEAPPSTVVPKAAAKAATKVEVYYDGLCEPRNPGGVATYGFVVYRDGAKIGEGRGLAAEPWSEGASNNVAEYTAMIKAFAWLMENGYAGAEVLVKGDSQLSIRQMQGAYEVRAPRIVPLYLEARRLSSNFGKVWFQWIPREENGEADMLSQLALRDYWRLYKAEKAAEVKPGEIVLLEGPRFRVRGYIVDLEAYVCECPDYGRSNRNPRLRVRLPCKHILAAERHVGAFFKNIEGSR